MDVLLDFPRDVLESTTLSLPAFCLPITSMVQLTGEVVWTSHRWGLGMPRHRKTRLLHWPAYRLLFLIQVLDWRIVVSLSNTEQGGDIFYSPHRCSCPDVLSLGTENIYIWLNTLQVQTWTWLALSVSWRKTGHPSQIIIPGFSSVKLSSAVSPFPASLFLAVAFVASSMSIS